MELLEGTPGVDAHPGEAPSARPAGGVAQRPAARDVAAELAVVDDAFGRPTLRLLRHADAAVRVAVLRVCFDADRRSVPTAELHARVGALVDSLRAAGRPVSGGSGRDLCRAWMRARWLARYPSDDGGEVYELTSSALEALEIVQSLSRERQLLSESRLAAILDALHRQAIEASPDAQPRIDRLDAQIRRLTAERDRLAAGEAPELASDDRMLEGYHHLIDLIGQLPSDFKRVSEEMRDLRSVLLEELRSDSAALGVTIDEYLARSDRLLDTAEGRAFDGALSLLRDRAMLEQLAKDLEVVLEHPFTEVLTVDEVRAFRGTVEMIHVGLTDVLAQRQRTHSTLADRIRNHDAVRERELSATLSALRSELASWFPSTGPRARVDVALLPERVPTLPRLRERFYDPADHAPPPPISDVDDDGPSEVSLEEILSQGGPLLARVRDALVAAGSPVGLVEAFEALPVELRRPVEVFGVLQLLAAADVLRADVGSAAAEVVRTDGSRRRFLLPELALGDEVRAGLSSLELT